MSPFEQGEIGASSDARACIARSARRSSERNLIRRLEAGGEEALERTLDKLAHDDPVRHFVIISAMFPEMARERIPSGRGSLSN
jgi:hypothetical protein